MPRQAEGSCPGNSSGVCRGKPSIQLVLAVFALVHANVSRDTLKARGSSSFPSKRLWVSPYINGDLGIFPVPKEQTLSEALSSKSYFPGTPEPSLMSRLMACPLDISRWMPASMEIMALEGRGLEECGWLPASSFPILLEGCVQCSFETKNKSL